MQSIPNKPIPTEALYYAMLESPVGLLGVAATERGVCNIRTAQKNERQFVRYLEDVYACTPEKNDTRLQDVLDQLNAYFEGELTEFDCALDLTAGTAFQKRVWKRLLRIPYGETCSYSQLAKSLSKSKAHRAVGNANGRNPVPIIVPCHRVIHADGGLGGYTGGLHIKEFLLDLEQNHHALV